jgi:hypothetical protein
VDQAVSWNANSSYYRAVDYGPLLMTCLACGALVAHEEVAVMLHDDWHDRMVAK